MKKTVLLLIALVICMPVITFGANGQPFQDLQNQINQIKIMLQNIQLTPGPQGPPGISGYEIVRVDVDVVDLQPNAFVFCTVPCPAGKAVLGGGGGTLQSAELAQYDAFPVRLNASGIYEWVGSWTNPWENPVTTTLICRAICAYVQ